MSVSVWNKAGLGYVPTATRIPFGGASGLTDSAGLTWNDTTKQLSIVGAASASLRLATTGRGVKLELVDSTGVLAFVADADYNALRIDRPIYGVSIADQDATILLSMDNTNHKLKMGAASEAANNARTVTVGNVGPGAATVVIKKWFEIRDSAGVQMWIPMFGV